MIIPRREFLRLMGIAAGAAGMGGCGPSWSIPDRLVEEALRGPGLESRVQTVCGLCTGGCGLTVRRVDGLPVGLKGNRQHPLNRGGLCPVGQAGLEILYSPERLQRPLRRDAGGGLVAIGWEEALAEVAARLAELVGTGRPHRVALLSGAPGEPLDELARRFLGALGSSSFARVGDLPTLPFELSQGVRQAPGLDLARSDLVLSFGLDLFEDGPAPLHAISALIGSRETAERATYLHTGTRLSPSASKADEFVGILPGTHGALALGVAQVLVREGRYDHEFVADRTLGFEDWTDEAGQRHLGFRSLLLERYYPDRVAQLCGCEPARIAALARRFAAAARPLAVVGGEALWSSNGTWTAVAVHALNALVGAFDRDGGIVAAPPIPLAPLPPPGALAAGSVFSTGADGIEPTRDAVETLADRVLEEEGAVEVLFIVGADPVHSSPFAERLLEALDRIPLVVALSSFLDETAARADLVLPAHVFLEAWEGSTTPSGVAFSSFGLGQPVIEPLFDTRHPGDVLLQLSHQVLGEGSEELPWATYEDYLRHRLAGLAASGEGSVITGSFEETWVHYLEERGWRFLERKSPDDFWSDLMRESGWWNPVRQRGDWARLLPTPSGRFELFSSALEKRLRRLGALGGEGREGDEEALQRAITALGLTVAADEVCLPHFEPPRLHGEGELVLVPFRPITARGRFGPVSPMVMEMFGYPLLTEWRTWVELAPETARRLELGDGDEVEVRSDRAAFTALLRVNPGGAPGVVHVPLGLGHGRGFGAGAGIGANPLSVMLPARDPLSGGLSLCSTRVGLRRIRPRAHGAPAPLEGGYGT